MEQESGIGGDKRGPTAFGCGIHKHISRSTDERRKWDRRWGECLWKDICINEIVKHFAFSPETKDTISRFY